MNRRSLLSFFGLASLAASVPMEAKAEVAKPERAEGELWFEAIPGSNWTTNVRGIAHSSLDGKMKLRFQGVDWNVNFGPWGRASLWRRSEEGEFEMTSDPNVASPRSDEIFERIELSKRRG